MSTIIVKVGQMPGTLSEVALSEGATVRDALSQAGLSVGSNEIRVNGQTATESTTLSNNAIVLLVAKIKGNK
jgi:putative ubiquitin-RnfH superfamily antitoxin RatB of RatAB toxin-antitoxin module